MAIEVEGPDGSVIEFPDGTSNQVMQRAMADKFGGPKNKPAPKPTTRPKKSSALDKFLGPVSVKDLVLSSKSGRPQATTARERGFQKAKVAAEPKKNIQRIEDAGSNAFFDAAQGGYGRGFFSLPDVIAAAVEAPFSDKDFGEVLDENRGATDFATERSTAGNIIGQVAGALRGGKVAGTLAQKAGARIAGSGAPNAVRASGRALQALATARKGEKVRNAAKITVAGAAGGGATAVGEGSDVGTGAAIGGIAAPVIMGGMGAAKMLARPFADALGMPNAGAILRRFTTATSEEMEAAAQKFRDDTGAEPTLFEILPLKDRQTVARDILGRTEQNTAQTAAAVRSRVQNIGPEMQRATRQATGAGRQRINEQIAEDMAAARNVENPTEPNRGILPGGYGADRSPIDMKNFQGDEAAAGMAGVRDTEVAPEVQSLFPTSLRQVTDDAGNATGEVEEVFSDPEVNAAIVNAASSLRLRLAPGNDAADVAGITADDAARIIKMLSKVQPGTPQKGAAMRAEQVIMDYIESTAPEARAAIERMRASYAARARMIEGMAEGGRTRTRGSIPVEKADQARKINNAYDSPEGTQGRFLGQSNALERDFGGTGQDVARRMGKIVESGEEQLALRQNLGDNSAEAIQGAAEAQSNSMRALAGLEKEKGNAAAEMSLEDLGSILLSLSPKSMIRTKAWALSRLTKLARLPDAKASQLIDNLFSQDPTKTRAAIRMLNNAGEQGRRALQQIGNAAALGGVSASALSEDPNGGGNPMPEASAEEGLTGSVTDESPDQEYGSYDEVLADWEANEDPELINLIDAQFQQESGNQQFDDNGNPLASSAGAIGIAQVMPGTAPEAAELAGLEWDEDAYYNDPAYNKLLGIAYMKEMLRRFDGDVALALAAYNAGPGAVENAGGVPNIEETQNYVDRILARR